MAVRTASLAVGLHDEGRERLTRDGVVRAATPSTPASRNGVVSDAAHSARARSLTALPRWRWMSQPGVSPLESLERQRHGHAPRLGRRPLEREDELAVPAPGAADVEDALLLGVEVDELAAGEQRRGRDRRHR